MVLTAVAYAFLQRERMRPDADPALTLPALRAVHNSAQVAHRTTAIDSVILPKDE